MPRIEDLIVDIFIGLLLLLLFHVALPLIGFNMPVWVIVVLTLSLPTFLKNWYIDLIKPNYLMIIMTAIIIIFWLS